MGSTMRRRNLLATLLALIAAGPAEATFVGDLVYCDLDRDGRYEPAQGDFGLNGVGVTLECRSAASDVCAAFSTTTGTIHSSAASQLAFFQQLCAPPTLTWDPDVDLTGRYLFEVFDFCGTRPGPWTCTVTVDQSTAPATCPALVTPLVPTPPADGNNDGDRCDAQDGPFPENQPLGNLPQTIGQGQLTCGQAPDPAPGNGTFTVTVFPITADDCALYNDFGFAPTSTTTSTSSTSSTSSSSSSSSSTSSTTTTSTVVSTTTSTTVPDHFKCYKTREMGFPRFEEREVSLLDQFGPSTATVVKPYRFCNPVDKNGEGVSDPTAHLMCYRLKEPVPPPKLVIVRNQFGEQTLAVLKPETLCTPAEKDLVPSDLAINHFKCYRVRGRGFETREVGLVDQFESTTATVLKPYSLCTPVDKNGEGIADPVNHLTCYRLSPREPFEPRDVTIVDQFAEQDVRALRGECRKVDLLCVPSTKEVIAAP